MLKMARLFARHWKLEQLSRICVREIVNALGCNECAIMRITDQNIVILASKGMLGIKKDVKISAALDSFRNKKKSVVTGDVTDCISVPGVPYGSFVNSIIWTPIITGNSVEGLLYTGYYSKNTFSDEAVKFLEALAGDIATAFLYNLPIQSGSQMIDETTGAYSKSLFDSDIADILSSSVKSFSLIMLDIDDLPQYIEHHGDTAGDRLLQNMVPLLTNNTRPLDRFYRYGKEEFIILLEEIEKNMAVSIAQRLNKLVAQTNFPGKEAEQHGNKITISAGVSCYPGDAQDSAGLIQSLYTAVAQAKQSGGNKVCHFESNS